MVNWAVVRNHEIEADSGVRQLVGGAQGAVHLEVALVTLNPDQVTEARMNPFEESFYILDGTAMLQMHGRLYALEGDDFGYVPVGTPHRWENRAREPARYLRVRAPQPRGSAARPRVADLAELHDSTKPKSVDPDDPSNDHVGHYSDDQLPAPGPLQMKGFRSASAKNVGLWMLVDEAIGAVHHTLFMVQFSPTTAKVTLGGQHYHPFEEIYYIVEGEATAHLEDESIDVSVGDVVFAGVNALHGFSNTSDDRVRWIEAQSPAPPPANAFFFPSRWTE